MRSSMPVLGALLAAGSLAVAGAAVASPEMFGAGWAAVLALLVVRLVLARPRRSGSRLLVPAALLGLAFAVLLKFRVLAARSSWTEPKPVADILAMSGDPARWRAEAMGELAGAGFAVLACAAAGLAILRLREPASRAAVIGLVGLVVATGIHVETAIRSWQAVPDPAPARGTIYSAANEVVSTMDTRGAVVTAMMLAGACLIVIGSTSRRPA
ncbi:hypothetical protein QLQ12_26105 [Actinoplanes sp. NEAU-A12]|uniref:Uncharacterized protein n=1 Tax=Actinoplanes sandaracinus TaxID=3045177 RepID=A0ABT6WQX4_9ACTN|nr:hypothetical protein [Actinoplanes sandaracinus]MDI6102096.1 hypothetical protein [Actinoplanes sandaracinus]